MEQPKTRQLEALVNARYGNIAGIVVLKGGQAVYEQYFRGCTAASRVHVYSVTKSVVSILLGIALGKGHLTGVEQKVLEFFPEYVPRKGEKALQNITLEHMLTMTAPYRYRLPPYIRYFQSRDMVRFALDHLGGRGEIGRFRYAPLIGPDVLTGILARVTGQPVLQFAAENLFSPLGITVQRSVVFGSKQEQLQFNRATDLSGWAADASGTNTAGWGLTLSPMDMAKLGQLYLAGGVWGGRQVVPEQWVRQSTREHSRCAEMGLGYGYLWWLHPQGFAALGDGGNAIYVDAANGLVVAIAALMQPKAESSVELIQRQIVPLFAGTP